MGGRLSNAWRRFREVTQRAPVVASRSVNTLMVVVSAAMGWLEGDWRIAGVVALLVIAGLNIGLDELAIEDRRGVDNRIAEAAAWQNRDELNAELQRACTSQGVQEGEQHLTNGRALWVAALAISEPKFRIIGKARSHHFIPHLAEDDFSGPRSVNQVKHPDGDLSGLAVSTEISGTSGRLVLAYAAYEPSEPAFSATDAACQDLAAALDTSRLIVLVERLRMTTLRS